MMSWIDTLLVCLKHLENIFMYADQKREAITAVG